LGGVGIGDHQADVVTDDASFFDAERLGERVDAGGGGFHVETVGGNAGIADAGRSGAITVNFSARRGMMGRHIREVWV